MSDSFFRQKRCFNCECDLDGGRIMSWFIDMAICMDCHKEERELRNKLPNGGRDHEGCGYIPTVEEDNEK